MDEAQKIDAMRKIREAGEEMFGIYHSHPSSEAVPSVTDIKEAAYPDAVYFCLIVFRYKYIYEGLVCCLATKGSSM